MSVPPSKAGLKWLLIAILAALQINTIRNETATWDEPVHLAAGYSYWITGQYQLNPEHPAFVKLLCALPLYWFYHPKLDVTTLSGQDAVLAGNLFVYRNTVPPDTLLLAGRLMNICLTLLFAIYFSWWAERRFGMDVALFALALFAFDPNIIAHGRYITTDLAAAFFIFTTCTLWLEYLSQPKWSWLLLTGISLGLAFSSKYSTLYLAPVLAVMVLCQRRRLAGGLIAVAVLSIAVLAIVYWPEVRHSKDLGPLAPALTRKGATGPFLSFLADRLHMPSYRYLVGLDRLSEHNEAGHPSYLLGELSDHGWWYYFPVAFAVKTPAAILVAAVLTMCLIWRSPQRALLAALIFPAAVYFGLSMRSHINIGIRHLLPVYAFLYIAMACVLLQPRRLRLAVLAVPLLVSIESLGVYPDYLAFFNVFAGGPNAGPKYLLDSNLDWGQDYKKLARYLKERALSQVCLGSFANVDFPYYGIHARNIPDGATAESLNCVAAVSATPLFGQYVGLKRFAWLRARQPLAIIGHSIYLYDLRRNRL